MTKKIFKNDDLNRKRSHIAVGPLAATDTAKAAAQVRIDDEYSSVRNLAEEYEIADSESFWMDLAIALARDFVPAFQEKSRPGPKLKWTEMRKSTLVVELDRLARALECTVEEAADELAKRKPWIHFLQTKDRFEESPDPGEALRKIYYQSKRSRWSQVTEKAFRWHEQEDSINDWESEVLDLFKT